MSLLSKVTSGKVETPDLVLLYGPDGVGKSTFAANAPKPIFLGPEQGTSSLDVSRFPKPETLSDVNQAILELTNEKHEFQTLVIDSADWIEPLVNDQVCQEGGKVSNIELAYGGYGKGYIAATKLWKEMTQGLTKLREIKKMNIIILAHAEVKTFQDPQQNAGYDRYQLKLQKGAAALLREFVDCVFFANFEVYTKQDGQKRTRAFGDGARYMYTERRPAFDAKNRFSLPPVLPLSWEEYVKAKKSQSKPDDLQKSISELLAQVTDKVLAGKVEIAVKDAGSDISKLTNILNRLRVLLN